MKKQSKEKPSKIWLEDSQLAAIRMQAIEVAARLPEPEPSYSHAMMGGGSPARPGKSAEKVVADAQKILAFVTMLA